MKHETRVCEIEKKKEKRMTIVNNLNTLDTEASLICVVPENWWSQL